MILQRIRCGLLESTTSIIASTSTSSITASAFTSMPASRHSIHSCYTLLQGLNKYGGGDKRSRMADKVRVYVRSGSGGQGCPPTGGVGGKGGNVIVKAMKGASLKPFVCRPSKRIIAGHGTNSTKLQHRSTHGNDVTLLVPPGTVVKNGDSGKLMVDLEKEGDTTTIARGGFGGNSSNGWVGQKGQPINLGLELKLIADVGLIGFPNAGKSTLLRALSVAKPKVGSYPFTTINPMVGFVQYDNHGKTVSVADLPGLIEGAHENRGMGHKFLKHVERTKAISLVIDVNGFQLDNESPFRSAFQTLILLVRELLLYDQSLVDRPIVLTVNKMDKSSAQDNYTRMRDDILSFTETSNNMDECVTLCNGDTNMVDSFRNDFRSLFASSNNNIVLMSAANELGVDALKGFFHDAILCNIEDVGESSMDEFDAWDLKQNFD